MNRQPDQHIYDSLYYICQELGYTVYENRPAKLTDLPFVSIEHIQVVPIATKTGLLGRAYATVNVWGAEDDRAKVSNMSTAIFTNSALIRISDEGIKYSLVPSGSSIDVYVEQTETDTLWRGRVLLEFNLY